MVRMEARWVAAAVPEPAPRPGAPAPEPGGASLPSPAHCRVTDAVGFHVGTCQRLSLVSQVLARASVIGMVPLSILVLALRCSLGSQGGRRGDLLQPRRAGEHLWLHDVY